MKLPTILPLLLAGFFLATCSSTEDLPRKAMFPFEYLNEDYQIISISSNSGEGMNILMKVHNDTAKFRILDQDQDGILDVVQYGDISLDQANHIYMIGISEAENKGKVRERNRERLFHYTKDNHYFKVQTFGLYSGVFYNRFIVGDIRLGIEETYLDVNADGILDKPEYANRSPKEMQPLYLEVLQHGLDQERIIITNDKYVVKISYKSPPS